jgi:hypothetical protein
LPLSYKCDGKSTQFVAFRDIIGPEKDNNNAKMMNGIKFLLQNSLFYFPDLALSVTSYFMTAILTSSHIFVRFHLFWKEPDLLFTAIYTLESAGEKARIQKDSLLSFGCV